MKYARIYFLILMCVSFSGYAQYKEPIVSYDKKEFVNDQGSMPYAILLPENYDPSKKYPMLLFLHGAGERGNDNELQLLHGSDLFTSASFRKNYPAIVVFPQCEKGDYWSNVKKETTLDGGATFIFYKGGKPTKAMALVQNLLDELLDDYPVDKDRLYVGGLSMGGMGTFEIVRRNPRLFAAAFPICGGATPKRFRKYKRPAWWVFHGLADPVVPYQFSTEMVKGLEKVRVQPRYSLYQGVGHNSWDNAFKEASLFPWLFSQSK